MLNYFKQLMNNSCAWRVAIILLLFAAFTWGSLPLVSCNPINTLLPDDDSDGDGVADIDDACPRIYGSDTSAGNTACSLEVKKGSLFAIDLSRKDYPLIKTVIDIGDGASDIASYGDYFYVSISPFFDHDLINVYTYDGDGAPLFIKSMRSYGYAGQLLIWENYLFVTNAADNIMIYDLSDPENPSEISEIANDEDQCSDPYPLQIHNGHLFHSVKCDGRRGLFVYDLSDISNISVIQKPADNDIDKPFWIIRDTLYELNESTSSPLVLYDISNPAAINYIKSVPAQYNYYGTFFPNGDTLLYISNYEIVSYEMNDLGEISDDGETIGDEGWKILNGNYSVISDGSYLYTLSGGGTRSLILDNGDMINFSIYEINGYDKIGGVFLDRHADSTDLRMNNFFVRDDMAYAVTHDY